ncbi:MAG: hypothetical protein IJX87_00625 [Clostridia bacterium]|nr:hypothetical protein [Clostridia bacterium]
MADIRNKKLIWYEGVKLLLLPTAVLAAYLLSFCVFLVVFPTYYKVYELPHAYISFDKFAETMLYIAFCVLMAVYVYRSFAYKKLYDKVRVSPYALFAVRLMWVTVFCAAATLLPLVCGTALEGIFKGIAPKRYAGFAYNPLFSLLNRNPLYCLFPLSVAMFGAVIAAAVSIVVNAVHWAQNPWLKIVQAVVWTIIVFLLVFTVMNIPYHRNDKMWGMEFFFSYPMPFEWFTYDDFMSYMRDTYTTLRFCAVSWRIDTWIGWFGTLAFVFMGFASTALFRGQINDDYVYVKPLKQKGKKENKEEKNHA